MPGHWQAAIDQLWSAAPGKGRVYPSVDAGLAALALPADWSAGPQIGRGDLAVTHRILDNGDLLFVSNRRSATVATDISFHVIGRIPEFWDAVTGERRPAGFRIEGNCTVVPMTLAGAEATFVVFSWAAHVDRRIVEQAATSALAEWGDGWTLALGEAAPITLDGLPSWATLPAPTELFLSGVGR